MKMIHLLAALHIRPVMEVITKTDAEGNPTGETDKVRAQTPGKCQWTGKTSNKMSTFHVNRKGTGKVFEIRAISRSTAARVWFRDHREGFEDALPAKVRERMEKRLAARK
jgi:hypothetical protein